MWQKPGEMSPSESQFVIGKVEMAALHSEMTAGLDSEWDNGLRFCIVEEAGEEQRRCLWSIYLSVFCDLLAFGPIQVERGSDYSDKPYETSFVLFSSKAMFRLLKLRYLQLSLGFSWTMVRQ